MGVGVTEGGVAGIARELVFWGFLSFISAKCNVSFKLLSDLYIDRFKNWNK